MKKAILRLVVVGFVLGLLSSTATAEIRYTVTGLGKLGETRSYARSINNHGQIVGCTVYSGSNNGYATLFDSTGNGNNINLGTLGGPSSEARSINNSGQIVGTASYLNGCPNLATLFDSTGSGNNIALDGLIAYSINDNGQMVGEDYHGHAFIFDPTGNGNDVNLGNGVAYSINKNGQIVGTNSGGATLFDSTGKSNNINLGTLGKPGSEAFSINNNGQIVGYSYDIYGNTRAALFDSTGNGNNINLGKGWAKSINNKSQIVGYAQDLSNPYATLFDSTGNGNNINLNTLIDPLSGWDLRYATCINDNGWIVGYGVNSQSTGFDAFLLTPVPEPASLSLLVLGGLALMRKRKA